MIVQGCHRYSWWGVVVAAGRMVLVVQGLVAHCVLLVASQRLVWHCGAGARAAEGAAGLLDLPPRCCLAAA